METDIRALMCQAHRTACDKGWWDEERSFGDVIAMAHSELSEALEAYRKGYDIRKIIHFEPKPETPRLDMKPEGVAVEFADLLIRIFDDCEHWGIPLIEALNEKLAYNKTRPYRHGNKKL